MQYREIYLIEQDESYSAETVLRPSIRFNFVETLGDRYQNEKQNENDN